MGVAVLSIGVVASSGYGRSVQVQLPVGQQRSALGLGLTFQGVRADPSGKDRALIAVSTPEGPYRADPALYWSEFNQAYMKKPHIQRYLSHDVYISPLEMVGGGRQGVDGVWFRKGESKKIGEVTYTFVDFDRQMGDVVRVAARMRAEIGGRTVPVRPVLEINLKNGIPNRIPDYLPGGAWAGLVLLGVAALGGLVLNLRYHWNRIELPVWLILVHAAVAVVGLVVVAIAVW